MAIVIRSLKRHMEMTVGRCGTKCLHLSKASPEGTTYVLLRLRCKSYLCPHCRRLRCQVLYNKMLAMCSFGRWRFMTLTYSSSGLTIRQHALRMKKAWVEFRIRLRKSFPQLRYIRICENHQSGYLHFHVAISQFIPYGTAKHIWHTVLYGGSVFIKEIPSKALASYLVKYMTKTSTESEEYKKAIFELGIRRYQSSQLGNPKYLGEGWSFVCLGSSYETELERWQEHVATENNQLEVSIVVDEDEESISIFDPLNRSPLQVLKACLR